MRKTYIEMSQKLICCNKVKVIIITSENVCWNIRNVKLKLYFFPAMRSSNPLVHKTKLMFSSQFWSDKPKLQQSRKNISQQGNIIEFICMYTSRFLKVFMNITRKASEVVAVIARYIVPGISTPGTKSVHTVFIFPVIWLVSCLEPETA